VWLYRLIFSLIGGWLAAHSLAVQALISIVNAALALVLTGTTIYYAIEARRSRVAAQESARATGRKWDVIHD
jgi:hypothetical protein